MRGKSTHESGGAGQTAADHDDLAPCEQPTDAKGKVYSRPVLRSYGRLADITQFGGSQVVDTGGGLGNLP